MEGAAIFKTLLLLQDEKQTQQNVRERQKESLRRDGPHQIDQVAPRRSVYEPSLPEALSDSNS